MLTERFSLQRHINGNWLLISFTCLLPQWIRLGSYPTFETVRTQRGKLEKLYTINGVYIKLEFFFLFNRVESSIRSDAGSLHICSSSQDCVSTFAFFAPKWCAWPLSDWYRYSLVAYHTEARTIGGGEEWRLTDRWFLSKKWDWSNRIVRRQLPRIPRTRP